jgi:hypothetical protein
LRAAGPRAKVPCSASISTAGARFTLSGDSAAQPWARGTSQTDQWSVWEGAIGRCGHWAEHGARRRVGALRMLRTRLRVWTSTAMKAW